MQSIFPAFMTTKTCKLRFYMPLWRNGQRTRLLIWGFGVRVPAGVYTRSFLARPFATGSCFFAFSCPFGLDFLPFCFSVLREPWAIRLVAFLLFESPQRSRLGPLLCFSSPRCAYFGVSFGCFPFLLAALRVPAGVHVWEAFSFSFCFVCSIENLSRCLPRIYSCPSQYLLYPSLCSLTTGVPGWLPHTHRETRSGLVSLEQPHRAAPSFQLAARRPQRRCSVQCLLR